jgi:hypothetical protein
VPDAKLRVTWMFSLSSMGGNQLLAPEFSDGF